MEKGKQRPNSLAETVEGWLVNQQLVSQNSYYFDNTGWTTMEGIRSDYVGSMVSMLYIVVSK